ncbi:hypothetical protein [Saccharicrinis fermentans]|nr:hypothetical protein [Saccharicrinis fermentans]
MGGIFVSNHVCDKMLSQQEEMVLALVELQTRVLGYPSHNIPEEKLKKTLSEADFGEFITKQPDGSYAYPTLLLSVKK